MSVFKSNYIFIPFVQIVFFLLLTVVLLLLFRPKDPDSAWTYSGMAFILYIMANVILLFFHPNHWTYLLFSVLASVLYLIVIPHIVEFYIKVFKLEGSGESAMIFLVIMFHPVLLLGVILLKWLLSFFKG